MVVGKSVKRVDALDKVTGRAKYTDDLADRGAFVVKLLHATIAHGFVKSIDTGEAAAIAVRPIPAINFLLSIIILVFGFYFLLL